MVAEDYCSTYLVKKYFRHWQDYVTEQQIMLWEKERIAEEHNEWWVLFKWLNIPIESYVMFVIVEL